MGDRSERTFVRIFSDTDHWWAQRTAASGRSTDADLPDFTFAHDGLSFAGEEKTTDGKYIYVDPEKLEDVQRYAAAYGMHAVIVGRFKGERAFYIWNPNDMETTDAGTLRGHPDDGNWAVKIAEPLGTAEGIHPSEISSFALRHTLKSKIASGRVEPFDDDSALRGEANV